MRTPETLTATERAARLRAEASAKAATGEGGQGGSSQGAGTESSAKARTSLLASAFPDGAADSHDADGSLCVISIHELVPYRHNPRRTRNPAYAELKESIRALNITNTISVTRRPGEERYFPFGGGNTRLEIARELHAEGDERFSKLKVVIKPWTHESDVLAAHMAENVNRGETTFWDNAQGVTAFKREWEQENPGQVLVASALNQQLRMAGVNHGVKTIQNSLFAVEHLSPVGPWIRSASACASVRLSLGSYLDLADRLDRRLAASQALHEALEQHAQDLQRREQRNEERDRHEQVSVELNPDALLHDAAAAIARSLDLSLPRLRTLAAALQERSRLSAQDLLAMEVPPPTTTQSSSTGPAPSAAPAPADTDTAQADSPAADGAGRGLLAVPLRRPQAALAAMVGVVGGTSAAVPAPAAPPAPAPSASLAQQQQDRLVQLLSAIDQLVPIADCILAVPPMPFGYLMDLPDQPIHRLGETELPAEMARLREALWWLLTVLSGQTQGPLILAVREQPAIHDSRWMAALARGPRAMSDELGRLLGQSLAVYGGIKIASGNTSYEIFLASMGIWVLLAEARLAPLVSQLIGLLAQMRDASPEELPRAGHISLPEWDESMLR